MTTKAAILNTLQLNKSNFSKFGVSKVGLFGSYIRNEQSQESDIDLLIEFEPEKENFDNFMAVCDFFEKLFSLEKNRDSDEKWSKSIYWSSYFI